MQGGQIKDGGTVWVFIFKVNLFLRYINYPPASIIRYQYMVVIKNSNNFGVGVLNLYQHGLLLCGNISNEQLAFHRVNF